MIEQHAQKWQNEIQSILKMLCKKCCLICGSAKHNDNYSKSRISETDRADKFLTAKLFFQDDVYIRTCDLQDPTGSLEHMCIIS